jgi:tRNA pseudouridine38-40 synthase
LDWGLRLIGNQSFPHLGFRVSYDGSGFSGFQRQSQHRSIQEVIERSWSPILGPQLKIQFSSRTDAGVNAWDQWVMISDGIRLYELLPAKTKQALLVSLNAVLPESIRVWQALRLHKDFNPKSSPIWKEYSYRVVNGPSHDPLIGERGMWIRKPLDLARMRSAMAKFVGHHDFAAFATRSRRYEDRTERRILSAKLIVKKHPAMSELQIIDLVFRGEGFLHHMVRTMSGTLVEIGLGKSYDIERILLGRARPAAGVNASPHPLTLCTTSVPKRYFKAL